MQNYCEHPTPLGLIRIVESGGSITRLSLRPSAPPPADAVWQESNTLRAAKRQLEEYFAKERKAFDLPLAPQGTPFQRRVWQALQEIPYGQTRAYKDIASAVGCPRGFRAVGLANNRNPIAIVIPCHRVIGADGKLTGYAGGLALKEELLLLEGALAPRQCPARKKETP